MGFYSGGNPKTKNPAIKYAVMAPEHSSGSPGWGLPLSTNAISAIKPTRVPIRTDIAISSPLLGNV